MRSILAILMILTACNHEADFSDCKGDVMDVSHLHYLLNFHGEALLGSTDNGDGSVLELWVNDETGAWTVIRVIDDLACITDFGTDPADAPEM